MGRGKNNPIKDVTAQYVGKKKKLHFWQIQQKKKREQKEAEEKELSKVLSGGWKDKGPESTARQKRASKSYGDPKRNSLIGGPSTISGLQTPPRVSTRDGTESVALQDLPPRTYPPQGLVS